MTKPQFEVIKNISPDLLDLYAHVRDKVFVDGALSKKFKLLIALALDSMEGSTGGVRYFAEEAKKLGASKAEVGEALQVAFYVGGGFTMYTAGNALEEYSKGE